MSVVGEAALSVSFELLCKLASSEFLNFVSEKQVRKQLEEWRKVLPSVNIWLAKLQLLAHDLDDILLEFSMEALRRRFQGRDRASLSKGRKFMPACCTSFTPYVFMFNNQMISKIEEIAARLNGLALRRSQLELREINGGGRSKNMRARLQPASLVNESHVYGRETEKLKILELLKNRGGGEGVVAVILFFGMGSVEL